MRGGTIVHDEDILITCRQQILQGDSKGVYSNNSKTPQEDEETMERAGNIIRHHIKVYLGNQYKKSARPGYVRGTEKQRGRRRPIDARNPILESGEDEM